MNDVFSRRAEARDLVERRDEEARPKERETTLAEFVFGIMNASQTLPTLRKRKEFLKMPSTRSVKGQKQRSKAAWKRRRTRRK